MDPSKTNKSLITVGQVFRCLIVAVVVMPQIFRATQQLSSGTHEKSADLQKGMFFCRQVREPCQKFDRLPAFIFHSNPFKRGVEGTPWVDVIEPDAGYCLFHGDNRSPGAAPLGSLGNTKFVQFQDFYTDPARRKFAPAVLVFEQIEYNGNHQGYRRFRVLAFPSGGRSRLKSRRRADLVIELALFRLERENESFDRHSIDLQRDGSVSADAALLASPYSWRQWVNEGELAIEACRRVVAGQTVVDLIDQRRTT
jgi:hypothetical protein